MAKHGIRAWRDWIEKGSSEVKFERDSIIRRNADGSYFHHGAPTSLTRDAAPVGSEVGGVGENSAGYRENSKTMYAPLQGKVGGTNPQREDGATRNILARWKTGCEIEIVEDGDSSFLVVWEPLQPSEGNPQGATTSDPITRRATSMADPEKSFADPPIGPRAAMQDAHRQMFDRILDHNSKKPPAARRALAAIKRGVDSSEMINEANREFWSGKK
jgi:hypothetical protein